MKTMCKGAVLAAMLVIAATTAHGQAVPPQEPGKKIIADQIVAVVGGSAILYSDVDRYSHQIVDKRRQQGYTSDRDPINEALEGLMVQKLLYSQSLIDSVQVDLGGITKQVEENIQAMIKESGSVSALEAARRKTVFDLREELRQQITEMYHAEAMQRDIMSKVTITPGEVERFYRRKDKDSLPLVPEQYVYAQITKFPPSMQQAKQRAREKLLDMREQILGGKSFATLARLYSADPQSAIRGGEMDPAAKETFVAPFGDALSRLKPGQVSEVVETEFGFHIILLIDKKDNLYHLRHILVRPEYTNEELGATKALLDSLAVKIREGEITFEKAALQNSDDKFSKLNGGIVSNHELLEMYGAGAQYTSTQFSKEDLSRISVLDYRTISTMKPGEVSDAFLAEDLRGNQLAKIVKLLKVIPTHTTNLNEDYLDLENYALQAKQEQEFNKWLDKKILTMYVRIDPEFRNGEFENKNWLK